MVLLKAWIHGLKEGADEGNLEGRPDDRALLDDIFD